MKSRGLKLLFAAFWPLMFVEGWVARARGVELGHSGGGVDPLRIHQHADPSVASLPAPCRELSVPPLHGMGRMGA